MQLSEYIRAQREKQRILLMTHIVVGYPNLERSRELVDAMVAAGVDLIELQIPFSEPVADGPVILRANQEALKAGTRVADCLEFARDVSTRHRTPFLFMTYYNILHRLGLRSFAEKTRAAGVQGVIVPDCPLEESAHCREALNERGIAPIPIFSPTSSDARLRQLGEVAQGLVYVVTRKGVTGASTDFSSELDAYLARCRAATKLPLAAGFGISSKAEVDFFVGKVEIAVVGSQTLRVLDRSGVSGVSEFLKSLR
ncbi:MAG TPA: tryptophan synthase subunit alpha [Polyangiaceae bacterium]|nr:tryptophan synthase subunit alpha [Polyangiaceae bacterium]